MDERLKRRDFLRGGVAVTLGVGLAPLDALADEPRIRRYVKLGKTGLEISDISFGSGTTSNGAAVRHAFERGVNYFDTAESYPLKAPGRAEQVIGRALRGVREEVVIASKTLAEREARRGDLMERLERSLRRLQTDRIDVYFNHAVNELGRLRNPEWFEFVERAKQQGKIRFSGISGHGGHLIECLDAALDENRVDVVLVAHNFGQDPAFYEKFTKSFDIVANQQGLPRVLAKASEKGVGVIAMKTLMGAKLNEMAPWRWEGSTTAQAAFRWVLSNPHVDALIVTMRSVAEVDEYLGASGRGAVGERDGRRLARHLAQRGDTYCRHGCDACLASCPAGVEIPEVLRTRMYATHYDDPETARASYARIGVGAEACLSCSGEPCAGTCPYGLAVPDLTRSTPETVSRR